MPQCVCDDASDALPPSASIGLARPSGVEGEGGEASPRGGGNSSLKGWQERGRGEGNRGEGGAPPWRGEGGRAPPP